MRRANKETLILIVAYLAVGAASIGLAVFVSSQFLTPSLSQPSGAAPKSSANEVSDTEVSSTPSQEKSVGLDMADIQSVLEPYIYDPKDRRDPFKPFLQPEYDSSGASGEFQGPLLPLQRFDLDELHLIGIIWNVSEPRAMFEDPNKQVHILGKDERIGRNNGYIAVIREGEVVIVETIRNKESMEYIPRVMKLVR